VNIIALQLTITNGATGDVLFQSKQNGTSHDRQAQTCTIDGGGVTLSLWAIVSPR
jgi:hypothetical protein